MIFPCTVKKIDLLYSDKWFRVGITIAPLLLHLVYFLSLMPKAVASFIMCIRCCSEMRQPCHNAAYRRNSWKLISKLERSARWKKAPS